MKAFVFFIATTFAVPSFAAFGAGRNPVPDNELSRALYKINGKLEIRSRGYGYVARQLEMFGLATGATALYAGWALDRPVALKLGKYIVLASFIASAGSVLMQRLTLARRANTAEDYRTEAGLKYFFASPVPRQYEIAAQHPELAKFVIDIAQSYRFAETGLPAQTPANAGKP